MHMPTLRPPSFAGTQYIKSCINFILIKTFQQFDFPFLKNNSLNEQLLYCILAIKGTALILSVRQHCIA